MYTYIYKIWIVDQESMFTLSSFPSHVELNQASNTVFFFKVLQI